MLVAHLERLGFTVTRLPFDDVDESLGTARHRRASRRVRGSHRRRADRAASSIGRHRRSSPPCATASLFGRGAADMKTALAAMLVAIERLLAKRYRTRRARIGLLITSDEEGDAVDGTVKVIEHLQRSGTHIDYCIVGEPSSNRPWGTWCGSAAAAR